MARVYRAWDKATRQEVAIKRLYPHFVGNDIVRKRFISEGRIQKILAHPNIVTVFEIVERPMLAIIMEFVEGLTLDEYLETKGSLREAEVLDLVLPILSAVGFAHKRGIIHRDIKPSNILLSKSDNGALSLKIMDFGVAKIKGKGTSLTATGTTVGTLHYMSPEQIVGSKNIDGRADIYSLGVTLYKLVTGEVPFNAPTEFALMMAQVEAEPLPPSRLKPNMSRDLEKIILKAMAKKADDRFQTIREFTHALMRANFIEADTNVTTITDRISSEVLQFAMDADQVAQDRTGEIGWSDNFNTSNLNTGRRLKQTNNDVTETTLTISDDELLVMSSGDIEIIEDYDETIQYNPLNTESESETVALRAHVNTSSKAKIVFDPAESQARTAPTMPENLYNQILDEAQADETNEAAKNKSRDFPQAQTNKSGSGDYPHQQKQSGYNPRQSGQYQQQPSSYNPQHQSGYNPQQQPGYNPQQSGQYQHHPSNYNPQQKPTAQQQESGYNHYGANSLPPQRKQTGYQDDLGSNNYQNQRPPSASNEAKKQRQQNLGAYKNKPSNNIARPSAQSRPAAQVRSKGIKNLPTAPVKLRQKKEGTSIKTIFTLAAAGGMVLAAVGFLIFTLLA